MNFQKSHGAPTRARLTFRNASILALSFGLSAGALFQSANAAVLNWDDAGPSDIWSVSPGDTNWLPGNTAWINNNSAAFGALTGETVEVNGTVHVEGVNTVSYALTLTTGYNIVDTDNNGVIELSGSGQGASTAKQIISAVGTNTIGADIVLTNSVVGGATSNRTIQAGTSLTISGDISETGVAKSLGLGGGTLTLTGNNTFSGGLNASSSGVRINLGSAGAAGTGMISFVGAATLDNSSGSAMTLSNNNSITVGNTVTFAGSNDLSLGTGGLILTGARTVTTTAGKLTVAGISQDVAGRSLTKNGAGTLEITGASTYDGGTTLSAGAVILGNKASLGTGAIGINSITVSASTNLSAVNAITNNYTLGGASTVFQGSNSIEWAGSGTATGSRTLTNSITGGTLTFSNTLALSSNGNNNTLTFTGNGNTLVSGAITNGTAGSTTSGLIKSGSGTLALTNANSYGGATTLNAGTLVIGNGTTGSIGNSAVSVAAGTLTGDLAGGFNIGTAGTPLTTIGNGSGSADSIITGGNGTAGSIGRFATTGALTLASDSSFVFDLNSTLGVADQVLADGTTTIAAGAQFTFNYTGNGAGLFIGQTFTALGGAGAINGVAFTGLAEGQVFNVGAYQFTANNYLAADELTFTVTAVPEPSTVVMLLGGFGVALGLRRTRRHSA